MELYYWQNRPEAMSGLARRIAPSVEQHGTITQRIHYLQTLAMMALRRDRYFNCSDAIAYSGQALALGLETGNLGKIADMHFLLGFSYLWSDYLDEAETQLQIARELTEQSGHLVLLARAITYLAFVCRKREDIKCVREYAAYALKISEEAKMLEYMGMAHAQVAWLAWRAGALAETKREAEAAIEVWDREGLAQSVVMFQWVALFPLMGVALQTEEIGQAVQWARRLIAPSQQRLPDDLAMLLARAVAAWEDDRPHAAGNMLRQAFQRAQALHYM